MSHTTAIKSIKIMDVAALRAAVEDLNNRGIKMTLVEGGTPRAYFPNQQGLGEADYVINLQNSRYDIGLYRQEDGSLEVRTDFWHGEVEKLLGAQATSSEYQDQAKMGLLFQAYAVSAATLQAQRQGKFVRKVEGENGKIQLVIEGY